MSASPSQHHITIHQHRITHPCLRAVHSAQLADYVDFLNTLFPLLFPGFAIDNDDQDDDDDDSDDDDEDEDDDEVC